MKQDGFLNALADILQADQNELDDSFELNEENWDSMAILETIAVIDEEFDITVPAQELIACTSVGRVLQLVRTRVILS